MPGFILEGVAHIPVPHAYEKTFAGMPDGGAVLLQTISRDGFKDVVLRFLRPDGTLIAGRDVTLATGLTFAHDPQALVLEDGRIAVAWLDYDDPWAVQARNVLVMLDASGHELGRTEHLLSYDSLPQIPLNLLPTAGGGVSLLTREHTLIEPGKVAIGIRQEDFGATGQSLGDPRLIITEQAMTLEAGDSVPLPDGGRALLMQVGETGGYKARLHLLDADGSSRGAPLTLGVGMVPYSAQMLALPDGGLLVLWGREEGPEDALQGQRLAADGTALTPVIDLQLMLDRPFHFLIDLLALPDGRFAAVYSVGTASSGMDLMIQDLSPGLQPMNDPELLARDGGNPFLARIDSHGSRLSVIWHQMEDGGDHASTFTVPAFDQATTGHDRLEAMTAPGRLYLLDGHDEVRGSWGDDVISGNAGNDTIRASGGNDTMSGNTGRDFITGGQGSDEIHGGSGHDILNGSLGSDMLYGGTEGDVLFGGDGFDRLYGDAGNDKLHGDADRDWLDGGLGADTLYGDAGDDSLGGNAGSDLLVGNDGNDNLNGGFGNDRLHGGAGADRFIHGGQANHGVDWIQDYKAAEGDQLVLWPPRGKASDFQVNVVSTPGAGAADVAEAFVIYRPTGQILWALVDGGDDTSILLGGVNLLA